MPNYFLPTSCFMKKFLPCLTVCCLTLLLISCGDDEPEVDCNALQTELGEATAEYFSSALTYGFDDTSANCTTLKADLEKFISLAKSYRSCLPEADLADFDDQISEAEDALEDLDCP